MQRDEVLETLRRELQIPDLAFNSQNVCRLVFDGRLPVDLESHADSGVLHLHVVVGYANNLDTARMRELLSANLFGHGTAGATLGLDDQRDEILLFRTYALEALDAPRLLQDLVEFVAIAEMWSERLSQPGAAVEETEDDDEVATVRV